MGDVVAAAAAVHAPQLLGRPAHEELDKLDASTAALRAFGDVLDETEPDALIVIGTDHLEAFWLEAVPTFLLMVSDEAVTQYSGRERRVPIHTDLATTLLKGLVARDVDMAYSQDAVLGHAFMTPFEYVLGDRDLPVVAMHVNVYLPPLPSPRRCFDVGRKIADVLASRPERVAVLASGGMSHYPGTSRYYTPDYEFDEWIVQEIEAGRFDDLLALTPVQLDEVGEGELLPWFVMLGIIGPRPGTLMSYQRLSHHGHGVMQFIPPLAPSSDSTPAGVPPSATSRDDTEIPKYAGREFTFDDFVYYRFPEPSSFPLNRFLHQLVVDEALRERFVDDRAGVIDEVDLAPNEREALMSEGFDQLVEVGAHPLLALSARQLVALMLERRQAV